MPNENYQHLIKAIGNGVFVSAMCNEKNPAVFTDIDAETGDTFLHWLIKKHPTVFGVNIGIILTKMKALLDRQQIIQALSHKNKKGDAPLAFAIKSDLPASSILSFMKEIDRISPEIFKANLDDHVKQLLLRLVIKAEIADRLGIHHFQNLKAILDLSDVLLTKVANTQSYFFVELFHDDPHSVNDGNEKKNYILMELIYALNQQVAKENGIIFLQEALKLGNQRIITCLFTKLGKSYVEQHSAELDSSLFEAIARNLLDPTKNRNWVEANLFIYSLIEYFESSFVNSLSTDIIKNERFQEVLGRFCESLMKYPNTLSAQQEVLLAAYLRHITLPARWMVKLRFICNNPEIISYGVEQELLQPGRWAGPAFNIKNKLLPEQEQIQAFMLSRWLSKLLVEGQPLSEVQKQYCLTHRDVFNQVLLKQDANEQETFAEQALRSPLFHQTFGADCSLLELLANPDHHRLIRRQIKKALIAEAEEFRLARSSEDQIENQFLENIKKHIFAELDPIHSWQCRNLAELVSFLNDDDINWIVTELNGDLETCNLLLEQAPSRENLLKKDYIEKLIITLLKSVICAKKIALLPALINSRMNWNDDLQEELLLLALHSRDGAIFSGVADRISPRRFQEIAFLADATGWTFLHYAVFFGNGEMVDYIAGILADESFINLANLNASNTANLAILALNSPSKKICLTLLARLKPAISFDHNQLLFQEALYCQHEAALEFFLKGVTNNLDLFYTPITASRDHGFTLLHLVLRHGSAEVLDAVIKKIGAERTADFFASTLLEDQQKNWLTLLNANPQAEAVTVVALQPIKQALLIDGVMVGDKQLTLEQLNLIASHENLVNNLKKALDCKTPDFLINTLNEAPEVICAYIKILGRFYFTKLEEASVLTAQKKRQLSAGIDLAFEQSVSGPAELVKILQEMRIRYKPSSVANASSSNHSLFPRGNIQSNMLRNGNGL